MNQIHKIEIVVIGAGSGGLTAAIGLCKLGFKVAIIEKEYIGGDCTNFGCIPSKALLYRAQKFSEFKKQYLSKTTSNFETPQEIGRFLGEKARQVMQETRNVVENFRKHESTDWLKNFGLDFYHGKAQFIKYNQIKVIKEDGAEKKIEFKKCIIATGSRTFIPAIDGLKETPYLTNRTIFNLRIIPQKITILGNGPIGIEMAEAFANLGSQVIVIGRKPGILARSDKELSNLLQKELEAKGIKFVTAQVSKIVYESNHFKIDNNKDLIESSQLLIATGRQANLDLNLENAGIQFSKKGIKTNAYGQTKNSKVFATGDCVEWTPNFTHFADYMSQKIVTNLAVQKYTKLPILISSINTKYVPAVTYTSLELASIGFTEEQANNKYGVKKIQKYIFDLANNDRAKATGESLKGKIKIITKGFFGNIVGVHILADRAGEMLPEFQHLVQSQARVAQLAKIIRSYPTYTSLIDRVNTQWVATKLKK